MAKWSKTSTWNPNANRGQIRFDRFKEQYPSAIFKNKDGKTVPITEFNNYDVLKKALGSSKGSNPVGSEFTIDIGDGVFKELTDLDSNTRSSGTNAIVMEVFVACCALMPIHSYNDFLKYIDNGSNEQDLLNRMNGVTKNELNNILAVVEDDHSYAEQFIKVGKKIHEIAHMKNPNNYTLLSLSEWNAIKKIGGTVLSNALGTSVKGDKWNPADIVLIRNDFKLEELKKFTKTSDIVELNDTFDNMVQSGIIVPISIKKTPDAIRGSRGISKEIDAEFDKINIKKVIIDNHGFLKTKKGESIEVKLNYSENVPNDNMIQRRVLGWIEANGKEHVEKSAAIAMGTIELSSSWYVVNGDHIKEYTPKDKYRPKLKHVVISMTSKSAWLKFEDEFIVARFKGSTDIQLSVENERISGEIKSFNDLKDKDLTDAQKNFLMIEKLLENYHST